MSLPAVDSRIEAVTVFRSAALVTRTAVLDLPQQGLPSTVRISSLPLALDDSTVRVTVRPRSEGAAPVATEVRVGLEVPENDEELAPPRNEELRAARDRVARLEDQIDQVRQGIARLEGLAAPARPTGARGEPPPPSPTDSRLALLEFRHSELDRLGARLLDLCAEQREAGDQLTELEHRHSRASTARQAREHELRKTVVVGLGHPESAELAPSSELELEYLVPGAWWAPAYSIRFDQGFERARVQLRGMVRQASGEDWDGVRLTLSTAEPQRWTELPELPALRIGRIQPQPPATGWREPPEGADGLFTDFDRAVRATPPAEAEPEPVEHTVAMAAAMPDSGLAEESCDDLQVELAEEPRMRATAEPGMAGLAPAPNFVPPVAARTGTTPLAKLSRKRSAKPPPGKVSAPGPARPSPTEHGDRITAPADLLDYGRLRMSGADDTRRGRLRPAAHDEYYLELLAQLRVEVSFDLHVALQQASGRAAAVSHTSPPRGYVRPSAWEGFDHAYEAETPVDIPSDGGFHNVPVLAREAGARLRFVTVPRAEERAYRFAVLDNPLAAPLPEGPADVYLGSDLITSSRLDTVAPGGDAEIGLGAEESVKVARNTSFKESTSGLLGGSLRLEHEIRVEVANHLSSAIELEVRERVPVTREGEEDIQVEVTDCSPPWRRYEQARSPVDGGYRWRLTLAPGATETLLAAYTITLSSRHELLGGNRREE